MKNILFETILDDGYEGNVKIKNDDEFIDKRINYYKSKINHYENIRNKKMFNGICIVIGMMIGLCGGLMIGNEMASNRLNEDLWRTIFIPIIAGVIIAIFVSIILIVMFKFYIDLLITQYKSRLAIYETEDIKDKIDFDVFQNSIRMSYKYLDQYYLQTKEQAQRGFLVTIIISVIGALLVMVGIIAMFLNKVTPAYVSAGSGIIIEFISSIFFYLYNKTVLSMSKYHNKLVLSQNVSIALKVAESLEGKDIINAKLKIIDELTKNVNHYLVETEITKEND